MPLRARKAGAEADDHDEVAPASPASLASVLSQEGQLLQAELDQPQSSGAEPSGGTASAANPRALPAEIREALEAPEAPDPGAAAADTPVDGEGTVGPRRTCVCRCPRGRCRCLQRLG